MAVYYEYDFSYKGKPQTMMPTPKSATAAKVTLVDDRDESPLSLLSRAASVVTNESVPRASSSPQTTPSTSSFSNRADRSPVVRSPSITTTNTNTNTLPAMIPEDEESHPSPSLLPRRPNGQHSIARKPPQQIDLPPVSTGKSVTIPRASVISPTARRNEGPIRIPPVEPPVTASTMRPLPLPPPPSALGVFPHFKPFTAPTPASAFSIPMPPGMEVLLPVAVPPPANHCMNAPIRARPLGGEDRNWRRFASAVVRPSVTSEHGGKPLRYYKMKYRCLSMKRWEAHRYIEALAQQQQQQQQMHPRLQDLPRGSPWATAPSVPTRPVFARPDPGSLLLHPNRPVHSSVMVPY